MNRNTVITLVILAIAILATIWFFNQKKKTQDCPSQISIEAAEYYAVTLEDSIVAWQKAFYDCATGAGDPHRTISVPPPTRRKCNFVTDMTMSMELLQGYIWDLQDQLQAYKDAYTDCMFEGKTKAKKSVSMKQPCPPCPPNTATSPMPTSPPPVAKASADDDLSPEFLAAMNSAPISAGQGEPVDLAKVQGYREGPFCTTISADGYTQFCITDQLFRLCSPTINSPRHATANGDAYQLENDGYWVYTDRKKGLVTMDNLRNQTLMWCVFVGQNTEWPYPMFCPHEVIKASGLSEYKERAGLPSVHPNGIKYGDDMSSPDKNQGWRFHTKHLWKAR